jgi:hypothetical protein
VVDGLGQSLEIFILHDVIGATLFGSPLEKRAELLDARLINVDADDVLAAMREQGMAGMPAVVLLFVAPLAARSIPMRLVGSTLLRTGFHARS